jgi:chemotaxis protein CheX
VRELEGAITQIVGMVCTTMLKLDVEPRQGIVRSPGERTMVGCVQITGTWSGAVLVQCDPQFASLAAKIIFSTDGAPTQEEERDALGEIANQIAGNLKALLPSPSFLALPTISDGVDNVLEVLGSRVIEKFELQVAEHELTVVLVMRSISLLPVPWHS